LGGFPRAVEGGACRALHVDDKGCGENLGDARDGVGRPQVDGAEAELEVDSELAAATGLLQPITSFNTVLEHDIKRARSSYTIFSVMRTTRDSVSPIDEISALESNANKAAVV